MAKLVKGKIVVTGGAGFIGSALVWALNEQGISNIIVVDYKDKVEKLKNLEPLAYDDFQEADSFIDKIHTSPHLFHEVRTIFHLGACSSTTEPNVGYLIDNNYIYTKRLAHWALDRDIRFIYASSAATYGDGSHGLSDKSTQLSQLRPLNLYGYSKHLFDIYAQHKGLLDKIVGLKYFNVFGPNENHKGDMRSLVNKAFHQINKSRKVKLFKSYRPEFKDGEQKRDFLYVKDAAAMTLFLAKEKDKSGIFNIGSGTAITWKNLVSPIFQAMNLKEEIEFIEMPKNLHYKYQYFTQADISRLEENGYNTSVTEISLAVKDYIKNYLIPNKHLGE